MEKRQLLKNISMGLLLIGVFFLYGCNDAGSTASNLPKPEQGPEGNQWDSLQWDKGKWG